MQFAKCPGIAMGLFLVAALSLTLFVQPTWQQSTQMVYLTLSNGSDPIVQVELIMPTKNKVGKDGMTMSTFKGNSSSATDSGSMDMAYKMSAVDHQITPLLPDAEMMLHIGNLEYANFDDNGTVDYSIAGTDNSSRITVNALPQGNQTNLKVCVFGDYSANLYYNKRGIDLSSVVQNNECNLNLFIGRINWELSKDTGLYTFNPYVTLYHRATDSHDRFSEVPSIFGDTGHDLRETTFFQSVEVNGVVFIQITVEVLTMASLPSGSEQQQMVQSYFRETMYNELECKLQELYERAERPWIIVYMTHPYEINQHTPPEKILAVNDTDRLFEIAQRYRIDLLTSCGAEGMSVVLAEKQKTDPTARLPPYVQTTMVPCAGYQASNPALQSECSYVVLDFNKDQLRFSKKSFDDVNGGFGAGSQQTDGAKDKSVISEQNVTKTKERPDACVEVED